MFLLNYLNKKGHLEFLKDKKQVKTDILSGLTVALALIPEAIAFSFVAWVNPMVWLYAAFIVGLLTSIFWGRPGMISWATWSMAVIMTSLVVSYWVEYLFAAIILTWVIQILFWLFKFWKIIRLIPHPVMLGFVNGLAIIIFIAQIWQFKIWWEWIELSQMIIMILLILITMWIIHFLPKFTKSIPSWLVAIIVVTLLVLLIPALDWTRTVSSYLIENWYDWLIGAFPSFSIPVIEWNILSILYIILPYSFVLAIIGLTESLMTLTLIDEITETRWHANKESIGQWIANTTCGFFGAMWGCAMIWQSMINMSNGWRGRLSWISTSIFLILLIVFASSLIAVVPLAALVGLMFMVVIGTFAWPTIKMLNKIPFSDAFVLVSVTFITVVTWDLAMAVVSWVIISTLVFAWKKSHEIEIKRYIDNKSITHYELDWPLFFGSITRFKTLFNIKEDTKEVIIDFENSRIMDHSAIEAIDSLTEKYLRKGKMLHIKHLSSDCIKMLNNAKSIVDINILEDPKYFVSKYKKIKT